MNSTMRTTLWIKISPYLVVSGPLSLWVLVLQAVSGLPDICNSILEKWLKEGYIKHKPDQLTINQYEPGHGIPAHIDTHSAFEDEIISLSLGSEIVMDFKHPEGVTVQVMLPRRSLLVMTGESRYLWTHGITPRKFDTVQASEQFKGGIITSDIGDLTLSKRGIRTSFTFRKVRRVPCNCSYSSVCDRQKKATLPSLPESNKEACQLEQEHVHRVYDLIARHFSSTRHSPWPRITEFLKALPSGSIVADIGCGNGKYLGINKKLYMIGCDHSQNLLDICRERQFQALVCDALSIPFRSGSFDACISIAVIHHFSTAERRVAALQELVRLLRPGGQALIYVWAMEQEYKNHKSKYLRSQDVLVPWHLKRNPVKDKAVEPFGLAGCSDPCPVFHRYYHVFCNGELEASCQALGDVSILQSYYDEGNWCVVLQKV
ncbi:Alkylated DNA repair protein alkB homolog 8 [Lemmus lemmus]